jgi:transcriptional regulator GlxA family with amidase domain
MCIREEAAMRDRSAAANSGIAVYQGVEPIDIGGTVGVISMARRVLPAIEVAIVAAEPGQVALAAGLSIIAQHGFADALTFDQVIVPGDLYWRLILAAAGVLDGRAATTRRHATDAEDRPPLARPAELGRDIRAREVLVVDESVVTGGGVALAIDATLYLIGRLRGDDARGEVARVIEYDRAWKANRAALGIEQG